MTSNRGYLRRPEIQIARKILQTDEPRRRDIRELRRQLMAFNRGEDINRKAIAALNLLAIDELTDDDIPWIIQHHIKSLQKYCDMVDDAYEAALAGVPDDNRRVVLAALIYRLESVRPPARYEIVYPYTESDMIRRERIVIGYILQALQLMPYRYQPKLDSSKPR